MRTNVEQFLNDFVVCLDSTLKKHGGSQPNQDFRQNQTQSGFSQSILVNPGYVYCSRCGSRTVERLLKTFDVKTGLQQSSLICLNTSGCGMGCLNTGGHRRGLFWEACKQCGEGDGVA